MAKKNTHQAAELEDVQFAPGVSFARKAICWWLPLLYLLISDTFYLRTYDSAQIKITLLQMGGVSLIGIWVSLLILEGRRAFRREDFILLAPFFAYLVYVILSFLHAPYRGPSVDDFVRYTFYMSVTLIIIREFATEAIDRLTKILIVTAYISTLYGLIQFLDTRYFPAPPGPGLDPFVWRWAFGLRVFSTYGNPNFFGNFLVLILPIVVTQFLKRRSVFLLPLIFMNLLCLYATETKGAWLGFGISFFIFAMFYGYFFLRDRLRISKLNFILLSSIVPVMAFAFVLYYSYTRPISVSFRVATWLSTWEMIESHPLTGVGVGSFKVVYPAYRRPVIFHIEGKHNTETDHAENEHLEQWMDHGLIGGGFYLWIILFVTTVGLRGLTAMTENLKGARPPPVAYDLLGYLTALLGMLAHNLTDVSMRFVSSGIFLGLLPGVIVNLSRGRALWELHYKEEGSAAEEENKPHSALFTTAMWIARCAALAGLLYTAFLILRQFSELQGSVNMYTARGEVLQWNIAWALMLACVGGGVFVFAGILLRGVSVAAPLVLLATLIPFYYFWGWFKGDVYHNMAIFFSKQGKWEEAIGYYQKVNKLNEFFIMPYYFTGNVFNDRFDMNKSLRLEWGDKPGEPRTDFDRAMAAYEKVRSIAPNYVQMHHQVGIMYMKMRDYMIKNGRAPEADQYLDKALARFRLYENIDPVFAMNYYHKAQIYYIRHDLPAAEKEYEHNLYAWRCYVKGHLHDTADAYFNLGNGQYGLRKFREAAESYELALKKNPNHEQSRRNLAIAQIQIPPGPPARK